MFFLELCLFITDVYKSYGVVTVAREWVLDSITVYTVMNLEDYILTNVKGVKLPTLDKQGK